LESLVNANLRQVNEHQNMRVNRRCSERHRNGHMILLILQSVLRGCQGLFIFQSEMCQDIQSEFEILKPLNLHFPIYTRPNHCTRILTRP
jgi:hypothetical protein